MDLPPGDVEVQPEKLENVKEGGQFFECEFVDTEIAHKVAQMFLPGLATACVDNTTGDPFNSPASVAVAMKKEMVDYLIQRSETFVTESVMLENVQVTKVSDHPYDIISDFLDDFVSSKRNFLTHVSGWLLSEKREDKIDDFEQEMDVNRFWSIDRRESIARTVLKNVDFKNEFHCHLKFDSAEKLSEHNLQCSFRSINCTNQGCNARFCAAHGEKHDSICPFKILPCEQNCSDHIMRREMDRHCITVCPMKLVNCPFYSVGCQSSVSQSKTDHHCSEYFHYHLRGVLRVIHKEASVEDLERRAERLEKAPSFNQLAEVRHVRSLTFLIKDLESKLGPIEITTTKVAEELTETSTSVRQSLTFSMKDLESKLGPTETDTARVGELAEISTSVKH